MVSIVKYSLIALVIFAVIFTAYSLAVLQSYKKARNISTLPQPYRYIYESAIQIPLVSLLIGVVENDLFLVSGSGSLGRIKIAVYTSIVPTITIVYAILVILFTNIWYFTLFIIIIGTCIPYLLLTNHIKSQARAIRVQMIRTYEAAERYFSDNIQVAEAFTLIASSSTGSVKKVYQSYLNMYNIDKEHASEIFVDTVGDKFSEYFIKNVISYDEYGTDPCESISRLSVLATKEYSMTETATRVLKGFKMLALIILGLTLMFSLIANTMGTGSASTSGESFTYIAVALITGCLVMALFYERSA